MDRNEWLADRFNEHRPHLRGVAYRMLGSLTEADDAVQDAWLRVSRARAGEVENLGGWLTTIVARVSLNMLRSRARRREESLGLHLPDPVISADGQLRPEDEALLADSVALALLVVLDTLSPAERLAFVLHDTFELPFDEIAPMIGRSPLPRPSSATSCMISDLTEYGEPTPMEYRIEAITLPVRDVDRAKAFYEQAGWNLDVDTEPAPGIRVVQLTPAGSGCSITFGTGMPQSAPGSYVNTYLVVGNIEAAHRELKERGIPIGDIFHWSGQGQTPGLDPNRGDYGSYATFADPDGNAWLLQDVPSRATAG